MLLIQCTKKIGAELKSQKIATERVENDPLYSWHVNLFTFQRRKYAILMNDQTRYNLVTGPLGKKKFEQFDAVVIKEIQKALTNEGIDKEVTNQYIHNLTPVAYGPTCQRSIMSQINDQIMIAKVKMEAQTRGGQELDRQQLNRELNEVPMQKLAEIRPVKEMEKELIRRNSA